jgi:RNA polymerase sigma-70 factor (ECF subfamily)
MTSRRTQPALSIVPAPAAAPERTPKPAIDDDQLLAGLRRGDVGMAEDFYWRVKPVVTRTVRRLLGRLDQDGEDIAQLTMIHLIEAIPRYRGECPLDAWVSAVSANVIYKHIRRRSIERSLFDGELDDGRAVASGVVTPFSSATGRTVQARDLVARIATHLGVMDPDRVWAYLLHEVCGYSLEEIAHICQISPSAAQSRLSRGRRELHERIAADPALAELLDGEGGCD